MPRKKMDNRVGETKLNYQNSTMTIVLYNNVQDIVVEFQDKYKSKVHTTYQNFKNGSVKNPYCPSVLHVGAIGSKYNPYDIYYDNNGKKINKVKKEYRLWKHMLERCFDNDYKERQPTYKDVTCVDDWALFENFYEWIKDQENYDKWLNGDLWCLDKDILCKGNKIYSPETCCLVPMKVNNLFISNKVNRGDNPIGVVKFNNKYRAICNNQLLDECVHLGMFNSQMEAFEAYKLYKESIIKQVAKEEFNNKNITEKCYNAMIHYEIEPTD